MYSRVAAKQRWRPRCSRSSPALPLIVVQGNEWKLEADPEDSRTTLHMNGTLRLHPLPVLLFPGGHVAFVQRLPWK